MSQRASRASAQAKTPRQRAREPALASDGLVSGLLIAPLLAGCATGGGSIVSGGGVESVIAVTAPPPPTLESPSTRVLSGKAINGYLDLALVYVDLNQDGLLSAGEPLTVSREGNFSLVASEGSSVVVAALQSLSEAERVVADQQLLTLGVDLSEAPQTSYVSEGARKFFSGRLEANTAEDLQSINVTPLSTIAASLQRASGLSAVEADLLVRERFGVNPAEDYLSSENSTSQKVSQAVSDFYQVGYAALDGNGLSQQTSDALTRGLFEAANSLPASVSIGQLLSSPVDLRSVLVSTASDLGREFDISSATLKLNDLFQDRDLGYSEPLVRLQFDTGLSQLDGITSNPAILTAALDDPEARWSYGLAVKSVEERSGGYWSDIQWTDADPTTSLPDGTFRIFVKKPGEEESSDLPFVELTVDRTAPIGVVEANDVFKLSEQIHFEDYIPGFLSALTLSDEHLESVRREVSGSELVQYLISTDAEVTHTSLGWSSRLNLYAVPDQERSFYLSTRVIDMAGNTSVLDTASFRIDRLSPLAPDISAAKTVTDTGIYDWDNYSSTVSLADLYLSLRVGESPDDHALLYAVSPGDEQRVQIGDPLSFDELNDGAYRIDFRQVDRADNFSGLVSFNFVLDRIAPQLDSSEIVWSSSEYSRPRKAGGPENTFDEWGQYGYRRVGSDDEVVWFNFGRPEEEGEYDIQFRLVDRAGNFSEAIHLGQHELMPPFIGIPEQQRLEVLSIMRAARTPEVEIVSWLSSSEEFQGFSFQTDFSIGGASNSTAPAVLRRGVSLSSGALSTSAIEASSLTDLVDRHQFTFGTESFYFKAIEGQATEFLPSAISERSSAILLGDSGSDRFSDLRPGDVFLGFGGLDVAAAASEFKPLGLAFLSEAEKESLRSVIDGVPASNTTRDRFDGAYMVYLGQEGAGDEGIAITNAEVFAYQNSDQQFLTVHYNEKLNRFFFVHDASNNEFFYGGEATAALGLGGSDLLLGGGGDDFLVGGSAPQGGEDSIYGYAGNDLLVGGDYQTHTYSKYAILGGVGDDTIILGNGLGLAVGGPGRDAFHVAPIPGSGAEMSLTITDFNPSEDKVVLDVEGVASLTGGVFILRDSEEVIVDLAQMFLAQGPSKETDASLDSLLRIQVDGLGDVDAETILEEWFVFQSAESQIWAALADGWVALA